MSRGAVIIGGLLAAIALAPASGVAQESDQVGLAIVQACGEVDPQTEGVLAGVVRDERSGVGLDGSAVLIR